MIVAVAVAVAVAAAVGSCLKIFTDFATQIFSTNHVEQHFFYPPRIAS